MAGGESQHPEQVRDAILQEGARLAREGVDEALFQRLKKGLLRRVCPQPELL